MARILITGGSGGLGRRLRERLLPRGHAVRVARAAERGGVAHLLYISIVGIEDFAGRRC
jgi:uncharacterized protein YbjT (DUF2867 family)